MFCMSQQQPACNLHSILWFTPLGVVQCRCMVLLLYLLFRNFTRRVFIGFFCFHFYASFYTAPTTTHYCLSCIASICFYPLENSTEIFVGNGIHIFSLLLALLLLVLLISSVCVGLLRFVCSKCFVFVPMHPY